MKNKKYVEIVIMQKSTIQLCVPTARNVRNLLNKNI